MLEEFTVLVKWLSVLCWLAYSFSAMIAMLGLQQRAPHLFCSKITGHYTGILNIHGNATGDLLSPLDLLLLHSDSDFSLTLKQNRISTELTQFLNIDIQ